MLKIDSYNKKINKKIVFKHLCSILLEGPGLGTRSPKMGDLQPRVGPSKKCLFISFLTLKQYLITTYEKYAK